MSLENLVEKLNQLKSDKKDIDSLINSLQRRIDKRLDRLGIKPRTIYREVYQPICYEPWYPCTTPTVTFGSNTNTLFSTC